MADRFDDATLAAFDRAARFVEDYYLSPERYPVLSRARPGDLVRALPARAPETGESLAAILDDFEALVMPASRIGITRASSRTLRSARRRQP